MYMQPITLLAELLLWHRQGGREWLIFIKVCVRSCLTQYRNSINLQRVQWVGGCIYYRGNAMLCGWQLLLSGLGTRLDRPTGPGPLDKQKIYVLCGCSYTNANAPSGNFYILLPPRNTLLGYIIGIIITTIVITWFFPLVQSNIVQSLRK